MCVCVCVCVCVYVCAPSAAVSAALVAGCDGGGARVAPAALGSLFALVP